MYRTDENGGNYKQQSEKGKREKPITRRNIKLHIFET